VIELLLKKAVSDEEILQGRSLTENEEIAFRRGAKYGLSFDIHRDGDWDSAMVELCKKKNQPKNYET